MEGELTKRCTKCKTFKSHSCFTLCRPNRDGLASWCRDCMHEDSKKRVERRRFQGIISPERKTCKLCGEEKARESFFNNIGNPDGLSYRCKACEAEIHKGYIDKNKSRTIIDIPKTKKCPDCGLVKAGTEFYTSSRVASGLYSFCKVCAKRRSRSREDRAMKSRYGVEMGWYDLTYKEQGGVCAICSSGTPGGNGVRFQVDHDHDTGQVRGLLCARCNLGIGELKDSIEVLLSATAYI